MNAARQHITLEGAFPMHRGGHLQGPTIAYETWGILNEARDNAVLVFTGLSPSAHAASSPKDLSPGWWEQIVGVGRPIDTQRYFIICVNSIMSILWSFLIIQLILQKALQK